MLLLKGTGPCRPLKKCRFRQGLDPESVAFVRRINCNNMYVPQHSGYKIKKIFKKRVRAWQDQSLRKSGITFTRPQAKKSSFSPAMISLRASGRIFAANNAIPRAVRSQSLALGFRPSPLQ
jgi:hypothetical protein